MLWITEHSKNIPEKGQLIFDILDKILQKTDPIMEADNFVSGLTHYS